MDKDYTALARQQIADEAARAAEQAVVDRATQLRLQDERKAQLAALRARHGMREDCTLRELSDQTMAYENGCRSFIGCRFANSGRCSEILSPEAIADDARRAEIIALRDRLLQECDAQYAQTLARRAAA